jgi:DNA anti-recombination protein RmuC
VDLEQLRERLPSNLYWELAAPTKDPQVLRKRAEEGQRWNELYGKVQSNTATDEEIHQYYDHRRQVSEDFIAFASMVLREYGGQLSEQERGLYELSIQMHRTRLEELPGQVENALTRKGVQDDRRKQWRDGGQGP